MKTTYRIHFLCWMVSLAIGISAQNQVILKAPEPEYGGDTVWVTGYALDNFTHEHLLGITVRARAAKGDTAVVAMAMTKDYARRYGYPASAFNKKMDYYSMALPRPGHYKLEFLGKGYDTLRVDLNIPARKYGQRVKKWEMEDVKLQKIRTSTLGEVNVKASKIKMVMRGDTIVYDADAFNLAEGSMLDALVKQLPGVELRKDGRIYVNGRYIKSLLIDGHNFFAGDAGIALKNLPSYVVDKVKVYKKEEDWAYLRNPEDTLFKGKLVMDVRLKRQYSIGWLGNVEIGGGTGEHYMGRIFGMRTTDHSRISLYASANNVNDTRTPGANGDWTPSDQASGRQEQVNAGVDFRVDSRTHGTEYNATLTGMRRKGDMRDFTSATTFLPDGDSYQRRQGVQKNKQGNLTLKQKFTLPNKRFHLTFQPDIKFAHTDNRLGTVSAQFDQEPQESYRGASLDSLFAGEGSERLEQMVVNRFNQQSHYQSDQLNANGGMAVRWRSNLTGNIILLSVNGNYDHTKAKDFTRYDMRYTDGLDYRNQYDRSTSAHYKYNAQFQYTAVFNRVKYLLYYYYEQKFSSGDRQLYRLEGLDGWGADTEEPFGSLPSATGWQQKTIDRNNSNHATELDRLHHLYVNATVPLGKKLGSIELKLWGNWHNDRRDDLRQTLATKRRHKFYVDPSVGYNKGRFSLSYKLDHALPAMSYLLDVRDDSNPLIIWLGNDRLKTGYAHVVSSSFLKMSPTRTWSIMGNYKKQQHAVAQQMTYNGSTGVYTYQPVNVNGNWTLELTSGQLFRLGEQRRWQIQGQTALNVAHSVDYVTEETSMSSVRSLVQHVEVNEKVDLAYKGDKTSMGVTVGVRGLFMGSPRPNFEDIHAADIQYGATCSTRLPWRLFLETDLTMYHRRGYADHSMNTNDLVWNGSLSRPLDKRSRWTVKVTGFDLLHQLSNIRQQVNAQGRTETWHNTLPSYAMLHVKYMLDVKPKKKQAEK